MADHTTAEVQVDSSASHSNVSILSPDVSMMILTWVTFFLLLGILYKFAWKHILAALDAREESIRQSVENVEKIKVELEKINQSRDAILKEAEEKSKEILNQSRKGAIEAARVIHEKAKEEAHILLETAQREIKAETEKAQASLRLESAKIAVSLAGKLIEKNLDNENNRSIVDEFIKDVSRST